ncbi:MAG: hypothetical protein ABEK02_09005 [Haloquadratum sp.]
MYERVFDTDWETLSGESAIRRMYVLGIAAELGHGRPEERERIRELASSAYERSVLDLAFEEGKRKIQDVRPMHETDEAAWQSLIEPGESPPEPESLSMDRHPVDLPDAIDRPGLLEGFDPDDLDRLRLPSLLRRDE